MEDFSSNYNMYLPALNTFTSDTKEYHLDVNYKVNDARDLKTSIIIAISFESLRLQHMYIEAFN